MKRGKSMKTNKTQPKQREILKTSKRILLKSLSPLTASTESAKSR
jgi:hypothetical protein